MDTVKTPDEEMQVNSEQDPWDVNVLDTGVPGGEPMSSPPSTAELIKQAMQEHAIAKEASVSLQRALKEANKTMYDASDRIQTLCQRVLEEHLGSSYEARVVLYNFVLRNRNRD